MIQDIAPKTLHNEYTPKEPYGDAYAVIFLDKKVLIRETDGKIELPRIKHLVSKGRQTVLAYQYLFCIDEDDYFLYMDLERPEQVIDSPKPLYRFLKLSDIRARAERELCFAVYTAYHLYQWYTASRFCGRCGARVKPDVKERMLYCEACGSQIYPRISPAVIAAVTDGDRILLSKYAGREYKQYALIAGFVEIGETAEQTVRREVMEETGLRVKNIRYYKTQPWGIDSNLLIGFFADLDGGDTIHLDKEELALAEWVDREALKDMDDGFSLTREMMRIFYEGKEK